MAGIPSFEDFKTAIARGQTFYHTYYKNTGSAETGATLTNCWNTTVRPAAGAEPATTPGTVYSNTAGGMTFPNLDGVSMQKYVFLFSSKAEGNTAPGTVFLLDRLVGVSGISLTTTGDKTVNTQALTRYTDGVAVACYLEVTTTTATSAPIVSLSSYTNQAGTNGRAGGTFTFPAVATNAGSTMGPMPLADGDTGIRSVETLNVATAGTAGVCNVVLAYKLATSGMEVNTGTNLSPLPYSILERVYDGATLYIMSIGYSGGEVMTGEVGVVFN